MTKNTFLALVITASAFTVKAQISNTAPDYPRVGSPVENSDLDNNSTSHKLAKKGTAGSGWYNYYQNIGDPNIGGETFVYFGDVTLWPDSLPVMLYQDGPIHTGIHGIGQVLDPTSEWFQTPEAPTLSIYNKYSIDSIAFIYKYRHVVPGSVDTLVIDFFNNDKLVPLTFGGGEKTLSPKYIPTKNRSNDITSTVKILLNEDQNTTTFFYPKSSSFSKVMNVALPAVMNVKEGGRMGFAMTFRPGLTWDMGDTLVNGRDSINLPKKQLNSFQPRFLQAETGVPDDTYNYALVAYRTQRYSTRTNEWYYPSNAPGAKKRHLDAYFKLTYFNLSAKDINNQGYGLGSVYPNPVKVGNDVKIEFALGRAETVNLQLFNLLGSKVADIASAKFGAGENSVIYNTSDLAPGVYVYTLTAGGFKSSKKITVIN